jgi:hypothetical protein
MRADQHRRRRELLTALSRARLDKAATPHRHVWSEPEREGYTTPDGMRFARVSHCACGAKRQQIDGVVGTHEAESPKSQTGPGAAPILRPNDRKPPRGEKR